MTSFNVLIERCARKLEKDSDLFTYYKYDQLQNVEDKRITKKS